MSEMKWVDKFSGEPILSPCDDGVNWLLLEDFQYSMDDENGKEVIVVTKGLMTDFGSIPKIFQNIISPIGKPTRAFILHDALYQRQDYTRSKSDRILLDAMWCLGVNYFTRWSIYWAVRIGGGLAWRQHAKENYERGNPVTRSDDSADSHNRDQG